MPGNSWNIRRVEGGFIVVTDSVFEPTSADSVVGYSRSTERVFPDSSALMNFLHNEFLGSN